jgi:hypothetical protein
MEAGLHMLYVQAVKGDERRQFVLFPHARKELGVTPEGSDPLLLLKRTQDFPGNRSKWFHHKLYDKGQALHTELASLETQGFTLGAALAVPLETDDYQKAWSGDTPHKALRAVDRALRPLGITLK